MKHTTTTHRSRTALAACLTAVLAAAAAGSALAQVGGNNTGGLPQQVQRNLQASVNRLDAQDALRDMDAIKADFGPEAIDQFLAGAVVRLVFEPSGSYEVSWQSGGEVVGIDLGKKSIELPSDSSERESWTVKSGEFQASKKPQPLKMTLRAGGNEIAVDCFNKYRKSDETVTYFVGPLEGLFCMGLTDEALADQEG